MSNWLLNPRAKALSGGPLQQPFGQGPHFLLGGPAGQNLLDFRLQHLPLQGLTPVLMRWPSRLTIPRALPAIH